MRVGVPVRVMCQWCHHAGYDVFGCVERSTLLGVSLRHKPVVLEIIMRLLEAEPMLSPCMCI